MYATYLMLSSIPKGANLELQTRPKQVDLAVGGFVYF